VALSQRVATAFLLMTMADFADQLFDVTWEVLVAMWRGQTGTRRKEMIASGLGQKIGTGYFRI
jgi:hypothetical protein